MSTTSILGKVSSFFFFSGFVFAKIQYLPFPVVAPAFNAVSLLFYAMAYSVWFLSSHFHPNHDPEEKEWYGFAQFKEQHLFAATIGLLATTLSIAGIFVPILLVPAAWLFFASNLMWTIGEYHKLKNPPLYDEEYSHTYQQSYFYYAITMSCISAVAGLSATSVFLFPPLTIPILVVSAIIVIGLSVLAGELWLDYTFGNHKPTLGTTNSHYQMNQTLGAQVQPEQAPLLAPYHTKSPLNSKTKLSPPSELENIDSDERTCSMYY